LVNVDRQNVLDGGLRAFGRKSFNPLCLLDVNFVAEDGIDTGGLTKEFMRLAMSDTIELPIFAGEKTARILRMHAPCKIP